MALNKYMHPRNIYKTPPDFEVLAKKFEEFASIVKKDVTGKVSIDFKDPNSLRILTKCLLKSDFNLDVLIPEDRLVPTLPLRLNYVLWLEDLLNSIQLRDNIRGLDIGTGACAIYPLLCAVKNGWHMVATESDKQSFQFARENVLRNHLDKLIEVKNSSPDNLLKIVLAEECSPEFSFCMCNPPFYKNLQELCESRSPARLPPKNGFTGSPQELITEGGELTFCRKLIEESKEFRMKVKLFTTMVGHKYNLKELEHNLKSAGIQYTSTEFCQGRVTRWGLAWTFQDYKLSSLLPARNKPRKKNVPFAYELPEINGIPYTVEAVTKKIVSIMHDLQIECQGINKRGSSVEMAIKALSNTWSNQRRKRRLLKKQENEAKKLRVDENNESANKHIEQNFTVEDTSSSGNSASTLESSNSNFSNNNLIKPKISVSQNTEPVIYSLLKILKKENDIILVMDFLDGSAGKEGIHQIIQYIKNNWK